MAAFLIAMNIISKIDVPKVIFKKADVRRI